MTDARILGEHKVMREALETMARSTNEFPDHYRAVARRVLRELEIRHQEENHG